MHHPTSTAVIATSQPVSQLHSQHKILRSTLLTLCTLLSDILPAKIPEAIQVMLVMMDTRDAEADLQSVIEAETTEIDPNYIQMKELRLYPQAAPYPKVPLRSHGGYEQGGRSSVEYPSYDSQTRQGGIQNERGSTSVRGYAPRDNAPGPSRRGRFNDREPR